MVICLFDFDLACSSIGRFSIDRSERARSVFSDAGHRLHAWRQVRHRRSIGDCGPRLWLRWSELAPESHHLRQETDKQTSTSEQHRCTKQDYPDDRCRVQSLASKVAGGAEDYAEATEDRYAKHDARDRQLYWGQDHRRARGGECQVRAAAIAVFKFDGYLVTAGRTIHKTSSAVTLTLK